MAAQRLGPFLLSGVSSSSLLAGVNLSAEKFLDRFERPLRHLQTGASAVGIARAHRTHGLLHEVIHPRFGFEYIAAHVDPLPLHLLLERSESALGRSHADRDLVVFLPQLIQLGGCRGPRRWL